ncbi:hypothetical protein ACOQFO_16420 [Ureibacillus sp. MALMAid1270]|uniref:hypothetical protein n=1 Tax=Ureibacillus sp. MALMAid1270 TaxID=3411629 RepID=UPI003BA80A70
MTNKDQHSDHHGTGAKFIVAGGFISSLGEFIQAIGGSLIAIEKMRDNKKIEKEFDKKIHELEKQIQFLQKEMKKMQRDDHKK